MGSKDLGTPTHLISSSRPTPRKKKCPRTNKENPNCQDILPRTTLSSANRNHGKGTEITEREGATSPRAVSSSISKEVPSAMGYPQECGREAIPGEVITSALNTHS